MKATLRSRVLDGDSLSGHAKSLTRNILMFRKAQSTFGQ